MNRGKKIVILAHCLLNVNAKVQGLAGYQGTFDHLVVSLMRKGFGIIQLPCPEIGYFGLNRWGQVTDQMDIPSYRRYCREILSPVIDQIGEYHKNGYLVAGVVGIDKSPSCGIHETCHSELYKGEISCIRNIEDVQKSVLYSDGPGIFMDEFRKMMEKTGLDIPFVGIDEEDTTMSPELFRLLLTEESG